MLFTEELRKCLDAAGLSDCGENDAWNYWYQRVLKAHNEAVERQIATEQAENAKLRELVRDMWTCILTADKSDNAWDECPRCSLWNVNNNPRCEFNRRMKELGVEV